MQGEANISLKVCEKFIGTRIADAKSITMLLHGYCIITIQNRPETATVRRLSCFKNKIKQNKNTNVSIFYQLKLYPRYK